MSRSNHFQNSQYFVESNFPLIDLDEITKEFDGVHSYSLFLQLFGHEHCHSLLKRQGDITNRLQNSMKVINKILYQNVSQQDADSIIKLELANQILHKKSSNLQEAVSAYFIDLYEDIFVNPSNIAEFKMADFPLKKSKEFGNIMKVFHEDSRVIKNTILSNTTVKAIYDNLVWISDTFDDEQFPINITRVSLDLPHRLNLDRIISDEPSVDPEWRFNSIVDSLKSIEKKNLLHKVPKLPTDDKFRQDKHKVRNAYAEFLIFIHKLTGLDVGFVDFLKYGIDEHNDKLTFVPSTIGGHQISKKSTKYKTNDIFSQTNLVTFKNLAEFNIWTGFKINEEIGLVANSGIVPDEVLDYWILHFFDWTLKECVIMDLDVDSIINRFPLLPKLKEVRSFQVAKSIRKSLDFQKSHYYEEFNKMRNV